jgi:tRNA(Arg) A34 adenosine deaminase TadA
MKLTPFEESCMAAAIDEAKKGLTEGGIPIGSVIEHKGKIIGRGHNRRVQNGSAILHGEMDALENAGRLPAGVYRECTLYTTLSPAPCAPGRYCFIKFQGSSSGKTKPSWVTRNFSRAEMLKLWFYRITAASK